MKTYNWLFFVFGLLACKSETPYEILISSDRNGQADIFLIDENGEVLRQITKDTTDEWAPVWIDQNNISYLRQLPHSIDIVVMNLDNGLEQVLPQPPNCKLDDKNFDFYTSLDNRIYSCKGNAYMVRESQRDVLNLTKAITSNVNYLSWGPSMNELTFTSNHEGNNEVYLYNRQSNVLTNFSKSEGNDERGDISPDGKWIVYSTNRFTQDNQDLILQNLETSATVRLTDTPGNELIGRWSKDQKKIFYGSDTDGNWEIYAYDLSSKRSKRITHNTYFDGGPRLR
jgi:TolB protein